jgi:hypothetical protein
MSTTIKVGDYSPWGQIQAAEQIAPGIVQVGTAGHGGIWLSPERKAALPACVKAYRSGYHSGSPTWWEEDCEAALVAVSFPEAFGQWDRAVPMVWHWYPTIAAALGLEAAA